MPCPLDLPDNSSIIGESGYGMEEEGVPVVDSSKILEIVRGVVADSYSHHHTYSIITPLGYEEAIAISEFSSKGYGASDGYMYPVGANVIALRTREPVTAGISLIVLGGVIDQGPNPSIHVPRDILSTTPYAGILHDEIDNDQLIETLAGEDEDDDGIVGGIDHLGANKAYDLLPGDWAKVNEIGVGFALAKFLATMGASEMARVETHSIDELVRLCSRNFEHLLASEERYAWADGKRFSTFKISTPYIEESLGLLQVEQATATEASEATELIDTLGIVNPGDAEDVTDDKFDGEWALYKQMAEDAESGEGPPEPKWRIVETEGWLGDIYRKSVLAPAKVNDDVKNYTVYDEWIGEDGFAVIRSAAGIVLAVDPVLTEMPELVAMPYEREPNPEEELDEDSDRITQFAKQHKDHKYLYSLYPAYFYGELMLRANLNMRKSRMFKQDPTAPAPELTVPDYYASNYPPISFKNLWNIDVSLRLKYKTNATPDTSGPNSAGPPAVIAITPDRSISLGDGYGNRIVMNQNGVSIVSSGVINIVGKDGVHTLSTGDTSHVTTGDHKQAISGDLDIAVLGDKAVIRADGIRIQGYNESADMSNSVTIAGDVSIEKSLNVAEDIRVSGSGYINSVEVGAAWVHGLKLDHHSTTESFADTDDIAIMNTIDESAFDRPVVMHIPNMWETDVVAPDLSKSAIVYVVDKDKYNSHIE